MTTDTPMDTMTGTSTVVSLDTARGRPSYTIPHREPPKPRSKLSETSEEASELIPIARGEDISLLAVERQAYAVAIEARKLEQLARVCQGRIAETNGHDRAAFDVSNAIKRGGDRAKSRGCNNE